jgi:hypothetical protein
MSKMSPEELEQYLKDKQFVLDEIKDGSLVEIEEPKEPGEAIVLYFDDNDDLRHSGIIKLDSWPKVMSRWINEDCYFPGVTFTHGIWEVPTSFGTKIKYYVRREENGRVN